MKEMFKEIPQTIKKALTPKQKVQTLMTNISGGWYIGKKCQGTTTIEENQTKQKITRKAG